MSIRSLLLLAPVACVDGPLKEVRAALIAVLVVGIVMLGSAVTVGLIVWAVRQWFWDDSSTKRPK